MPCDRLSRHQHPDATEHSWVGRTGEGYRYDHAFCQQHYRRPPHRRRLRPHPRVEKLSDHSALTMWLDLTAPPELPVTNPVTAAAEPTLF